MTERDMKWQRLTEAAYAIGGDGRAITDAMKKLYSVYSADMLGWLGGLFDTGIGGFYYSETARDGNGYLPDVESTYQAIVLLQRAGVISAYGDIPEMMRRNIATFVCSLEDSDTGYFYHPQWGKDETGMSRKGRDLAWAKTLSKWLDFELPYPDAFSRAEKDSGRSNTELEVTLTSRESLEKYLDSLDFEKKLLQDLHRILSQADIIRTAGYSDVLRKFFDKKQNPDTGLFSERVDVDTVMAFFGVVCLYNSAFNARISGAVKIIESITSEILLSMGDLSLDNVSAIRNIWGVLDKLIINVRNYGSSDDRARVDELLAGFISSAPKAICDTADKLAMFKGVNGSFSWDINASPTFSTGVSVAPSGTFGDVNGTLISVGTIKSIYDALGLSEYAISLFEPEEFKIFADAMRY